MDPGRGLHTTFSLTLNFQLYSYYGRTEPEEMHRILTKYRADYIILEESICLSQGSAGCRLKDIIDADRGQVNENFC